MSIVLRTLFLLVMFLLPLAVSPIFSAFDLEPYAMWGIVYLMFTIGALGAIFSRKHGRNFYTRFFLFAFTFGLILSHSAGDNCSNEPQQEKPRKASSEQNMAEKLFGEVILCNPYYFWVLFVAYVACLLLYGLHPWGALVYGVIAVCILLLLSRVSKLFWGVQIFALAGYTWLMFDSVPNRDQQGYGIMFLVLAAAYFWGFRRMCSECLSFNSGGRIGDRHSYETTNFKSESTEFDNLRGRERTVKKESDVTHYTTDRKCVFCGHSFETQHHASSHDKKDKKGDWRKSR